MFDDFFGSNGRGLFSSLTDHLADRLSWGQILALFLLLLMAGAVAFWLFPD